MATLPDLTGELRELLPRLRSWLQECGVENPGLEVRIFLSHLLNIKTHELFSRDRITLNEEQQHKLRRLLEAKCAGTPTAYLLGEKEFFSRSFQVTPDVLIPRPETEELAEWVLEENRETGELLDICCGSGCLGITLALELKNGKLTLADISPGALAVSRNNAQTLLGELPCELVEGDLFEKLPDNTFDLVVSNPPYVLPDEYQALDSEVKDFEPQTALLLPPEGEFNRRFAEGALRVMKPGARLYLETGPSVIDDLADELTRAGLKNIRRKKDLSEKWRFLGAEK